MSMEGDKDGVDEWLCLQWTLEDMLTNSADYRFWINGTQIIRMENYQGSNDAGGVTSVAWLNTHAGAGDQGNLTGTDWVEVRDNYHVTASRTPASCAQIGFDVVGDTVVPPPPDPIVDPAPEPLGKPGTPYVVE